MKSKKNLKDFKRNKKKRTIKRSLESKQEKPKNSPSKKRKSKSRLFKPIKTHQCKKAFTYPRILKKRMITGKKTGLKVFSRDKMKLKLNKLRMRKNLKNLKSFEKSKYKNKK